MVMLEVVMVDMVMLAMLDMVGFGDVHGGGGGGGGGAGVEIRHINDGRIRLLHCAVSKGLRLTNTCFQKRKSRLITFKLRETKTIIDYNLANKKYGSSVKDVKVISGEEIGSRHCLLSMDMMLKKKVRRKVKFRKKLNLWRLRQS